MKYRIQITDSEDIVFAEVASNDIQELYDKYTYEERKHYLEKKEKDRTSAKHDSTQDILYNYRKANPPCMPKDTFATNLSKSTKERVESIKNLLNYAIKNNPLFDWNILKDSSRYNGDKPLPPSLADIPSQPKVIEPIFSLIEKIIGDQLKLKKINATNEENDKIYQKWVKLKESIEKNNEDLIQDYESKLNLWEKQYSDFTLQQNETNSAIDKLRSEYQENKSAGIIKKHSEYVLRNMIFPSLFRYKIEEEDFRIFYNENSNILIVDLQLIPIGDFSVFKDIKYVKSQDIIKEVMFPVREFNLLYETYIYQITLSITYCLFINDVIDRIDSIVFNGWVNSIDKATGNKVNKCILSIQFQKKEFANINLNTVDAKECFRHFKGIGSPKLHELIPVAPILTINKEDKRFVQSYEVVKELDESINLAAMDWEDFEHLVRELFEKEFSQNGGEVKITRASRDGGVDAVAFDPDPIRGGKIVIQAKRYTNIVGVNAVRDLFGTVMNEGALKGILVTTSDYGSDAYEFAKNKPITLLTGNNLLHLLEKHGHKAKIDIAEAKKILSETDNP